MKHYFFTPLIVMLLSLILAAEINANQNIPDSQKIVSVKIGDKTLAVVSLDDGYSPRWFISSKSGIIELKNPPGTELYVDKLKVSDDKKYLAVLSAGEGHPYLEVFNLKEILDDRRGQAVYSVNPYPGVVDLVKWENHFLYVASNLFLTEKHEKYGRVPETLFLFSLESFLIDIDTGTIEPVSEKLKSPVSYYGTHLIDAPYEYSPSAELLALTELNDIRAIPYLKKALKMKCYASDKKEINDLLLKLKNKVF